ncbi:MAG: GH32 C-terminal domain-containing protein, partial [Chloroflexota bacterium]|nr:GH32 C-terminal domain-containing protein [Chloroflexota bacterium]
DQGSHAGVWECPDLFELQVDQSSGDVKWTLHISINSRTTRAMQYFIGTFDGKRFVNERDGSTVLWTDYGEDYYAAVSWFNLAPGDTRRVWIGWMNNWRYGRLIPTAPWQGAMSIPRVVGLRRVGGEVRLVQQPVAELAVLRREEYRWTGEAVSPGRNLLENVRGKSLEIIAEIELSTAQVVGFKLRKSGDQFTTVAYDVRGSILFVDRSHSNAIEFGPDFPGKHEAPLEPSNGRIKLHVFLDECSVEVFGNDGEAVLTDLIFPDPASDGLEVFATDGEAVVTSLVVYTLAPAHAEPESHQHD